MIYLTNNVYCQAPLSYNNSEWCTCTFFPKSHGTLCRRQSATMRNPWATHEQPMGIQRATHGLSSSTNGRPMDGHP